MELADALVVKTLEIFDYFSAARWTVENPATSLLWKRPVAGPLLEQIAKTSYCRYRYKYRKNTWFANNIELELRPQCDGTCGQSGNGIGLMLKREVGGCQNSIIV